MNRRKFCTGAGTTALGIAATRLRADTFTATLTLHEATRRHVPETFAGLSYELAQLTEPDFFSADHSDLVRLFRCLSPNGILRLGGNTSEFCWLKVDPSTLPPTLRIPPGNLAQNWMPHRLFAIPPTAIDTLAAFLQATGWKAIFGLNFGNTSPVRAAAEASFVAEKLSHSLVYFQIGNEPDFYRDANNGTRPPGWDFDDYVHEWMAIADAISARVPNARFGGPDTGASSDWITRFGNQISPRLGSRLVALSGHYYAEGPPNDPRVTTAHLLAGDPRVASSTQEIIQVADAHNLLYRMTEGNSCYRGGKPGMSNAFAASLWAADYLLLLASLGCAGVNLHGGDSRFLSAGLGDHNPGLEVPGQTTSMGKQPSAPNGFYTPIASEHAQPASARPVFYGMLLAQQFAGAAMLGSTLEATPAVTAYAAQKGPRRLVAVFNKDRVPITLSIRTKKSARHAALWELTGPSLDATSGITLGSAAVSDSGIWTPRADPIAIHTGAVSLNVAPTAGALVFLD